MVPCVRLCSLVASTLAVAILLGATSPILAQKFSVGVIAGVPLTDAFEVGSATGPVNSTVSYSSKTKLYKVGPSFEARVLPRDLSLEGDVLYTRLNYDYVSHGHGTPSTFTEGFGYGGV